MPIDIPKIFSFALYSGGKIDATVTGKRENKRKNVLEVPVLKQSKGT